MTKTEAIKKVAAAAIKHEQKYGTGRSFIGIDLKEQYCRVTEARLKELASQQVLI